MDENILNNIDPKQLPIFEEIFSSLDNLLGDEDDETADGLEIIGHLLTLPDEQFEIIKPMLMNTIEATFNAPDARIAFAQMVNQQGLRVEDLEANLDTIIQAISEMGDEDQELEISDSKKEFLQFIFGTFMNAVEASNMVSHRIINIPIELCRPDAKLPAYATDGSAAMDIYSPEEYTIGPGECVIVPTGLKVDIPIGYALLIQPRSGLSRKTKLRVANTPGLIDSDYHEEIGVIVENIDPPLKDYRIQQDGEVILEGPLYGASYTIGKGERFAQMRLVEVPKINWLQTDSLGDFDNDHGAGFGSTGTN